MNSVQKRLLITDSDINKLEQLKIFLLDSGYDVTTESEKSKIMTLIKSHRFDCILLDITVAKLNAYKIIDTVFDGNINTAIICVSDTANFDMAIETIRRGAFDILIKPYDIKSLPDLIEHAIRESDQEACQLDMLRQEKLSSDIYQCMIDNSQDIQYLLDDDGNFVFINKRVETLLGYRRSELIGKHYSALICHDDLMGWKHRFHDKRRNNHPLRNVELRFNSKNKNDRIRYFDVKSIPLCRESQLSNNKHPLDQKNILDSAVVFGVAHDVTARKKVERAVHRKASYDFLTGLPNKFLFYDRLNLAIEQAKRDENIFAVMFLDLDGFKYVNDNSGHSVGDKVLIEVSTRLRDCLRGGDTLARIGGDEFIFLLPRVKNKWEAAIIAKKITSVVSRPLMIDGIKHKLSVSVGIALYPEDGVSSEPLIHGADLAMYQVKHKEKNGFQFYSA